MVGRIPDPRGPFVGSTPPPADRPESPPPSYGVPADMGDTVSWRHVIDRLARAEAYWLATTSAGGAPHVVPVWGVVVRGHLLLEIGAAGTAKYRNLLRRPRVAVHLDDPRDVVLVKGEARVESPPPAWAAEVAAAFHRKHPGYDPAPTEWDAGGLTRVTPRVVHAWGDIHTATRWRLGPTGNA